MVSLTRAEYDVLLFTLAWVGGFLPLFLGRAGWTWTRCLGLALVLSPFVRMGINLSLTYEGLFVPTVLQPVAAEALWRGIGNNLTRNLLVPALGLLLIHDAFPRWAARRAEVPSVREIIGAHGMGPKHSWKRDALRGLALFFFIALAYVAAYGVAAQVSGILDPGDDESRYWIHVTIPLIVLISATAGLTEEFLFRGILLKRLAGWMPWGVAAVLQALAFALIHSGYGSIVHLLGPLAFGLGAAWVSRVLGIVPAMLLHAQVNVVYFAFDVGPDYVAANGVLGIAGLAALLLGLSAASVVALVLTKADAVTLLWRSLLRFFEPVPEETPEAEDRPGAT